MNLMQHATKCAAFALVFNSFHFSSLAQTETSDGLDLSLEINNVSGETPQIRLESYFRININNNSKNVVTIPVFSAEQDHWPFVFAFKNLKTGKVYKTRYKKSANTPYPVTTEGTREEKEIPAMRAISPGKRTVVYVKLNEINGYRTQWVDMPDPNTPAHYSLVVTLVVPVGDKQGKHKRTTIISSSPIETVVSSSRVNTPQSNLEAGNIDGAMVLFKRDRAWIEHNIDGTGTPLIVATNYNQIEVIQWLLKNGANVNAVVEKGKSALHFATTPETLSTILTNAKGIKFSIGTHWETPLRQASYNYASAKTQFVRTNWRKISRLLIDHGAYYDMYSAIWMNDLQRVKAIKKEIGKLEDKTSDHSPLGVAAKFGRLEICKFLIEECDQNVNDTNGHSGSQVIFEALNHADVVQLLIKKGAKIEVRDSAQPYANPPWNQPKVERPTPLHYASIYGSADAVKVLLDSGGNILSEYQTLSIDGFHIRPHMKSRNVIETAAHYGDCEILKVILSHSKFKDLDRNVKQETLDRCISNTVSSGRPHKDLDQVQLIELLLAHGANPNAKGVNQLTALQIISTWVSPHDPAPAKSVQQAYSILLQYGATADLYTAVAMRDELAVKKLIAENPKCVEDSIRNGYPALHYAVMSNKPGIVRLLISAGIDVNIKNESEDIGTIGEIALHLTAKPNAIEIADLLVDAGADVNIQSKPGETPLHLAVLFRNRQLIRLFLKAGADPGTTNKAGQTPWDMCPNKSSSESLGIKKLLEKYLTK